MCGSCKGRRRVTFVAGPDWDSFVAAVPRP
jgi:hypothetical protein